MTEQEHIIEYCTITKSDCIPDLPYTPYIITFFFQYINVLRGTFLQILFNLTCELLFIIISIKTYLVTI